jgi:hypothetical protein
MNPPAAGAAIKKYILRFCSSALRKSDFSGGATSQKTVLPTISQLFKVASQALTCKIDESLLDLVDFLQQFMIT